MFRSIVTASVICMVAAPAFAQPEQVQPQQHFGKAVRERVALQQWRRRSAELEQQKITWQMFRAGHDRLVEKGPSATKEERAAVADLARQKDPRRNRARHITLIY
jgi:hypothetical protein